MSFYATSTARISWSCTRRSGCASSAVGARLGARVYTLAHIDHFPDPGFAVNQTDIIIGTLLILATLEATRRTVGLGLSLTAVFFPLQTWQLV
jgi:TRAP-type uncharacterized transport system fused permease subunit